MNLKGMKIGNRVAALCTFEYNITLNVPDLGPREVARIQNPLRGGMTQVITPAAYLVGARDSGRYGQKNVLLLLELVTVDDCNRYVFKEVINNEELET